MTAALRSCTSAPHCASKRATTGRRGSRTVVRVAPELFQMADAAVVAVAEVAAEATSAVVPIAAQASQVAGAALSASALDAAGVWHAGGPADLVVGFASSPLLFGLFENVKLPGGEKGGKGVAAAAAAAAARAAPLVDELLARGRGGVWEAIARAQRDCASGRAHPPRLTFDTPHRHAPPPPSCFPSPQAACEGTDRGADATPAQRAEVERLVAALVEIGSEGASAPSPAESPLLNSSYRVAYTDNANAAGGPFRSPLGRWLLPTSEVGQTISPGVLENRVTFGFRFDADISGSVELDASLEPLSESTFRANFGLPVVTFRRESTGESLWGTPKTIGKASATEQEVLYLDDRIRISRGLSKRASLLVFEKC